MDLVENQDLDKYYVEGEIYCGTSCTGFPEELSSGILTVKTVKNQASEVIIATQTMSGIAAYGDNTLSRYERFLFPKGMSKYNDEYSPWREIKRTWL